MTLREAKKILESEEEISINDIAETQSVIAEYESKKKKKDSFNSHRAHQEWLRKNKKVTDLKEEIRKYW